MCSKGKKLQCFFKHLASVLVGVSPDKQTPRRSKYVSGTAGNGGQAESAGEAAAQSDASDVTEERLSKLLEEKMQNNGTGEGGMYL